MAEEEKRVSVSIEMLETDLNFLQGLQERIGFGDFNEFMIMSALKGAIVAEQEELYDRITILRNGDTGDEIPLVNLEENRSESTHTEPSDRIVFLSDFKHLDQ